LIHTIFPNTIPNTIDPTIQSKSGESK